MPHDAKAAVTPSAPPGPPTEAVDPVTQTVDPSVRRRVVAASFIGNFVEWFDYAVYGYLAAIIAGVFFPSDNPQTGLVQAYAVFALSFVIRPLGGFFWGSLGDRLGRRAALSWSILIMSVATFCIGILPTHAAIGLAAPLLLVLVRVVQGFSAAGEYAGASAFLVEYAPPGRRGIYAAVVPASTAAGLLLGAVLVTVLTAALSPEQLSSWGWRLPFFLAAPMGLIGRYIRTRLEDTPAFQELAQEDDVVKAPVLDMFRHHWTTLLQACGAVLLNAVGFYILLSYMPTYLSTELGLDATRSFIATSITLLVYIGFIFASGVLSDRFGRKRVLLAASVAFLVLTVPAFMVLGTGHFLAAVAVLVLMGAVLTLNDGVLPCFLAEMFPTSIRYSGFAVSFNLANALFGGTAPMLATAWIAFSGSTMAPAWMLMIAAVIAFVAVVTARERHRDPLQ